MSEIEKLYVRGIRSFSPEKPATIVFGRPLTLIVGPNGSGKTTLVECLKYCTSGLQPPNTKGGAFIFDPKLANEFEVKAQVKILFKNTNHKSMICSRSILLTQKKIITKQKIIEGFLLVKDPESGKTYSLNSKCAELDIEVPLQLGVTKAILDNVIFCHQEVSLWPISESSVLKKKFDDIFASTRYTKVLETIKAIRKEKQIQLNLLLQGLEYVKKNRTAADRLVNDKIQQEKRLDDLKCEIKSLDTTIMSSLAEKIKHTQNLIDTALSVSQNLSNLKSEKQALEALGSELHDMANVSEEQANEMAAQKEALLEQYREEQRELHNRRSTNGKSLLTLRSTHSSMLIEQGRLKCQINNYDDAKNKIKPILNELCFPDINQNTPPSIGQVNYDGIPTLNGEPCVSAAIGHLQKKNTEKKNHLSILENEILQLTDSLHSKNGLIQAQLMSLGDKLALFNDEMKTAQVALENVKNDIFNLTNGDVHEHLNSISKEIDILEEFFEESEKCNSQMITEERLSISLKIIELNDKLSKVQSELLDSIKHQSIINLQEIIDELKKTVEKLISERSKLVQQHNLNLEKNHMTHNIRHINQKINELFKSKNEIELKTKAQDGIIAVRECIAAELSSKPLASLYNQYGPLESKIKQLEIKIADNYRQIYLKEGEAAVYQNIIDNFEDMENEHLDIICPLCSNDIDYIPDVRNKLLDLISCLEHETSTIQKDAENANSELYSLKEVQLYMKSMDLIAKNSPEVLNVNPELNIIESRLSDAQIELEIANSKNYFYTRIEQIDKSIEQNEALLKKLDLKMESIYHKAPLSTNEYLIPPEIANEAKNKLTNEISQLVEKLNRLNEVCHTEASFMTEKRKRFKEMCEERDNLKDKITTIKKYENDIESLSGNIKEINTLIGVLNNQLNNTQAEVSAKITDKKQQSTKLKNEIANIDKQLKELEDFREIESKCAKCNIWNLLKFCDMEIIKIQESINLLNTSQDEISAKIEGIIESTANTAEELRKINNFKKYTEMRTRIKTLSNMIQIDQAKFEQFNVDSLSNTLSSLKKQNDTTLHNKAMLMGEMKQLELNIKKVNEDYSNNFSDINEQYNNLLINYKTEEIICRDLVKYYKALESAITKFHSFKMREINRSIKELWAHTYKNSDIDSIEIKSESNDENEATKSYNYKVVMIKKGMELDMRSRCSAGQKVLAAVVIRLALAETFCFDCGFFALDEPTTNIDRENVEGLALCLLKLIEKKRHQKNFQLLIITHDELFIQYFQRSGYSNGVWRVNKDMDGHSYVKHFEDE